MQKKCFSVCLFFPIKLILKTCRVNSKIKKKTVLKGRASFTELGKIQLNSSGLSFSVCSDFLCKALYLHMWRSCLQLAQFVMSICELYIVDNIISVRGHNFT